MKQPTEKQLASRKAFAIAVKIVNQLNLKGEEKKKRLAEEIRKHYKKP